jgi:hypothetical protein
MISCRTRYKSYREKNTHIHVLNSSVRRFGSAPLVRTRGAYGSIHGGARLKERSHYGSGSSVGLGLVSTRFLVVYNGGLFN